MKLYIFLAGLSVTVAAMFERYLKLDYDDDGIMCQEAVHCLDCCKQLCWLMADSEQCHVYIVPRCTKLCEGRSRTLLGQVQTSPPLPSPKYQRPWWWRKH